MELKIFDSRFDSNAIADSQVSILNADLKAICLSMSKFFFTAIHLRVVIGASVSLPCSVNLHVLGTFNILLGCPNRLGWSYVLLQIFPHEISQVPRPIETLPQLETGWVLLCKSKNSGMLPHNKSGPKHWKFWSILYHFRFLIVNIAGTMQDIQHRKNVRPRAIPPAFDEKIR